MNKHIELVKKWLADKDSVSLEELKANKENAYATAKAAAYNAADYAAYAAADNAAYYAAAYNAADYAADWVNKYEELTK